PLRRPVVPEMGRGPGRPDDDLDDARRGLEEAAAVIRGAVPGLDQRQSKSVSIVSDGLVVLRREVAETELAHSQVYTFLRRRNGDTSYFSGFGGGKGSTGYGFGTGIWAPTATRQSASCFRSSAAFSGCVAARSRCSPGSALR